MSKPKKPALMTDAEFCKAIAASFDAFIKCGTSRSTKKLKPLHGAIAQDFALLLGDEYQVKAQGFDDDREGEIQGRYFSKQTDITISRNGKAVAGVAVKFVMQNYSQNSNNYFENMLGETANIRTAAVPYFQIFIILDRNPYYDRDKKIKRWEEFSAHNAEKYIRLSCDDPDRLFHSPNKTLLYIVHLPDATDVRTLDDYRRFYRNSDWEITRSEVDASSYGATVIVNQYETFRQKVYHTILSL